MKFTHAHIGICVAALSSASVATSVQAADAASSQWGKVVALQAGWTVDRMLVFHGAEMVNPEGCSVVTNGYIIDEAAPGHSTFYTLLLSGLLNTRDVQFVVQGCFENRPRIVSVSLK